MKMKLKALLLCALLLFPVFCTGCGDKEAVPDMSGMTLQDIFKSEAYGMYVKTGDIFYPLQQDLGGLKESGLFNEDTTGFFWWADVTSEGKDIPHPIPKLTAKSKLVIVYGSNAEMPSEYVLTKFADLGYTVGGRFRVEADGQTISMIPGQYLQGTDFASIVSGIGEESVCVDEISGKIPPVSNIDEETGVMVGFQKHKYYNFNIYLGTVLRQATLHADTRAFKEMDGLVLPNPIKKTREGYFIVNLPENIEAGYYTLNSEGLFQVRKGGTS